VGENIYESPPIMFGDGSRKSEYLEKQKKVTQSLLEATESKTVTEFLVKLVYGEDFFMPARLLDTKIEASGRGVLELADAVEKVHSYNNFRGRSLGKALRALHDRGLVMHVRFGREGSPVCYVNPPYWTNQASNHQSKDEQRRYTDEERTRMYREITSTLRKTKPDELDTTASYGVRAWWD